MKIGFTGTQMGMRPQQRAAVHYLLQEASEVHLGDCIGADAEAHVIAKELGKKTIGHPPLKSFKRAFCSYDLELPPRDYLDRNHNIVDASEVLIATPYEYDEQLRSGTWATIRYARKVGRIVWLVLPDGYCDVLD